MINIYKLRILKKILAVTILTIYGPLLGMYELYQTLQHPLSSSPAKSGSFSFSPNGRSIAIGKQTGAIEIWEIDDTEQLWYLKSKLHHKIICPICSIVFSPDGKKLAAILQNGLIRIFKLNADDRWNVKKEIDTLTTGCCNSKLSFSFDSETLICVVGQTVILYNVFNNYEIDLLGKKEAYLTLDFSPNQKIFAIASSKSFDVNSYISLFSFDQDDNTYYRVKKICNESMIKSVALSSKNTLAAADYYGVIRIWECENETNTEWNLTQTLYHNNAGCKVIVDDLTFSPNGKKLAAIESFDGIVKIWKLDKNRQWNLVQTFDRVTNYRENINLLSIQFSPDGKRLAYIGADGTVRIANKTPKNNTLSNKISNKLCKGFQ